MKPIFTILSFLLFGSMLKAQTCTGSAGDPIVNITFGSGDNLIGDSLPAGITTLSFWNAECPDNGYYSITNRSGSCFNSSWHPTTDHTGDANGYFMLVNASVDPSNFYVQEIDGLCAGTQYRFGAWIKNLVTFDGGIEPNITFTIEQPDGTILSRYNTGNIPVNTTAGEWKEYAFNFTTPAGASTVVLRMRNNALGGVGNDLGIDDITFRPIGPKLSVSIPNTASDSLLVCSADPNSLQFKSSVEQCYVTTAYQWQVSRDLGATWQDMPGETRSSFDRKPTSSGVYWYRVATAQQSAIGISTCRVVSSPFKVTVYDPESRTIVINPLDSSICESTPATFFAHTTFAGSNPSFQWMVNDVPANNNQSDSSFTTSSLSSGDRVACVFRSSLSCNTPVTSNDFSVMVLKKTRSTVTTAICEGDSYEGYNVSGTYTDIFTGSNGCDSIRTLNLTVYPKQHSVFDTSICYGTSYLGYSREGSYDFVYPDVHGCDSIHTLVLHILPDINARPVIDTILCAGDSLTLSPGVFDSYLWQDGSRNPTYTVSSGGTYRVTATNKCGTATKTTNVTEKVCLVAFPTGFSPNGDGKNDVFRVVNGYNLSRFRFIIFDRWGTKIFESSDPKRGWNGVVNGRNANAGTYIWWCEYQQFGDTYPQHLRGTVVLVR